MGRGHGSETVELHTAVNQNTIQGNRLRVYLQAAAAAAHHLLDGDCHEHLTANEKFPKTENQVPRYFLWFYAALIDRN